MKVLWFVNIPMPAVLEHLRQKVTGSGWWLSGLANEFKKDDSIDLTIAHCSHKYDKFDKFIQDGITYWLIPAVQSEIVGLLGNKLACRLAKLVKDEDFDLIDVHGSEYSYGQIIPFVNIPVVITIQGFVSEVLKNQYGRGNLLGTLSAQTRGCKDFKSGLMLIYQYLINRFRSKSELSILKQASYFIGRTEWDKTMVSNLSASLKRYCICWEIMRPVFYQQTWMGDSPDNYVLFYCGRIGPYKGTDQLIYLLAELIKQFPKVTLRLAGGMGKTSWEKYVLRIAHELGVTDRVTFLGYLTPENIALELQQAAVFVYPSYVDNSSNSLAEAMCMGIPCVCSSVGGLTSMIEDGFNGLFFGPDNLKQMTEKVSQVLSDRELARKLGENAREIARKRHAPQKVADETKKAYALIINDWTSQ